MNAVEIEEAITKLAKRPFDADTFPYAFLETFGNKETTINACAAALRTSPTWAGVLQTHNIQIAVPALHRIVERKS